MATEVIEQIEPDAAPTESAAVAVSDSPWAPSHRALTIGLVLTIVGVAFEALAVATALPTTVAALDGWRLYGWVFSAFLLTNLIGIVVAGGEADRRGPVGPYLAGVVLFASGLLVGGLAPTMWALIAGRALQGFGGGVIISIAYVAIGRAYTASARPRLFALLSTAWVVPGLIGPAIAAQVVAHLGWRWIFLGLTPLPLLAAVLVIPALRRIPGGSSTDRDYGRLRRAGQLAVGAALLLAGLGRGDPLVAVPMVLGGVALAVPALRRLLPAGTLRAAPGQPAAVATMGLLNLAFFGIEAYVPLTLIEVRDRSLAFTGVALTATTIFWTCGSWVQARYSPHVSRRRLVRLGLSLLATGSALTLLILIPDVPAVLTPLARAVAGIGMGLTYSTLSVVILETATAGREGAASASIQLANVLGSGLGAGIGGALVGLLAAGTGVEAGAAAGIGSGALRGALLAQDATMVAVVALALLAARRIPPRPAGEAVP